MHSKLYALQLRSICGENKAYSDFTPPGLVKSKGLQEENRTKKKTKIKRRKRNRFAAEINKNLNFNGVISDYNSPACKEATFQTNEG